MLTHQICIRSIFYLLIRYCLRLFTFCLMNFVYKCINIDK